MTDPTLVHKASSSLQATECTVYCSFCAPKQFEFRNDFDVVGWNFCGCDYSRSTSSLRRHLQTFSYPFN